VARAPGRLRDRLDEQRLPDVQHQEREKDGEENASFHLERHWIVTRGAQRLTTDETPRRQPTAAQHAVARDGLGGRSQRMTAGSGKSL
jgi:hypothetical protein